MEIQNPKNWYDLDTIQSWFILYHFYQIHFILHYSSRHMFNPNAKASYVFLAQPMLHAVHVWNHHLGTTQLRVEHLVWFHVYHLEGTHTLVFLVLAKNGDILWIRHQQ